MLTAIRERESRPAPDSSPTFELSIVMPCLNEAETIEKCIVKARHFLVANGVNGEIVIGDNGSTDGSRELAERQGARVVDVPLRGYGAAICSATLAAQGQYIIMGDADDSYDFSALAPLLVKLREGYDVVMGNRFLGGIRPGAMPWKNRYIGNPCSAVSDACSSTVRRGIFIAVSGAFPPMRSGEWIFAQPAWNSLPRW